MLDVFQFTDDERFLATNPGAHDQIVHVLEDVVAGRADVAARLRGREQSVLHARGQSGIAPVVMHRRQRRRAGIRSSTSWPANTLGLLYRISRVIAQHGCDVDLVLIATEGEKAIDVFHLTKGGAKLTETEQQTLTTDLQRTLEELR